MDQVSMIDLLIKYFYQGLNIVQSHKLEGFMCQKETLVFQQKKYNLTPINSNNEYNIC